MGQFSKVFQVNSKCLFSPLSTSTVAGLEHLAGEDSLGMPEQAAAGEDKPVPEEGSPEVAAVEGSPEVGAVEGNLEAGSPAVGAGSTAAGGIPVLGEVADIHMGCSPLAWVCKADRAWALQVGWDKARALELLHRGLEQLQLQVVLLKVELLKKQTLWVEVDVLGGQPSWVAWMGHDARGLQVEGPGSLLPCWMIDPSRVLPSQFSWQSRNL